VDAVLASAGPAVGQSDRVAIASVDSLWRRAVDGDGQAFAVFYNEHADTVFGHCLRRLGSRTDAEDVTAEAFAITWRRRADISLDPDSDILAWLLTTANHLLQRHYRSSSRHRRFLERFARERTIEGVDHADGVDQSDEAHARALQVLDQLRPGTARS
jgi:RNA polymerase sigma-70 factor (ECF subfamily)